LAKQFLPLAGTKRKNGVAVEQIIPVKPAGQKYGAAMRELSLARAFRARC